MRLEEYIEFEIKCGEKEGDHPILILRRPTEKELCDFMDRRFARDGKRIGYVSEARAAFIDSLLVGCKNIEIKDPDGGYIHLMVDRADWKNFIPANWKTSICLKSFEEELILTPDEAKK